MIKKVRVDHRLIHGQITSKWMQVTSANTILIASDNILKDDLKMTVMKMAVPHGIKLVIKSVKDSIEALNSGVTDKYNLFILCEDIDSVYRLSKGAPSVDAINIGSTLAGADKQNVHRAIYLSEKEIEQLRELSDSGVEVNIQIVPDDSIVNIDRVLPK